MFPTMNTKPADLLISTASGHLEARFDQGSDATRAIVLCHPHPQYGGSMHDIVVGTVEGVARRHGFATLKFNFRGVGDSTGRYDNGIGEVDDLLTALAWLRDRAGTMPLWLAGYSFGSNVVWRSLERAGDVNGVVLVAPPVAMMDFSARPASHASVTLIAGDEDDYVDAADLRRWASEVSQSTRVEIIAGADHFFSGGYSELANAAERAFTQH
jgi:hypothetical protein